MDRSSIRFGSHWSGELLAALGTCQVFVALLSGPYASCHWCGMEWHGFSQRAVVHKQRGTSAGHQTPIFPVIWAPFPTDLTPLAIRKVQNFSPSGMPGLDLVAKYEKFGVLGLMQMQRRSAYHATVWALAQSIADFYHAHRVEPMSFSEEELRDVFGEDGL